MKAERPRPNLPLTKVEWALQVMTLTVLFSTVGVVYYYWAALPEQITVHFNIFGTPDRQGDKSTLIFLCAISVLNWLMMTILARFPHTFNYLKPITEKNAASQYLLARTFILVLNLEVTGIMFFAIWSCIQVSMGAVQSIDSSLISLLVVLFVSVAIYMFRANKAQ